MMQIKRIILAVLFMIGVGAVVSAQTAHKGGASHGHHQRGSVDKLSEPGQGALAALAEIVRALESDATTDWSKVDLTALRNHLVDMDLLVTDAIAIQTELPDGLLIEVTGDPRSLEAAKRMMPAHAKFLGSDANWSINVTIDRERVVMRATSKVHSTAMKIKALGFYGLMASQDHHRAHHWEIARGASEHLHK